MDENEKITLAETISALTTLSVLIVTELHAKGVLDKQNVAELVKRQILTLESGPQPHPPPRMDLRILRSFVSLIENPNPPGWTPTVIDGGKDQP